MAEEFVPMPKAAQELGISPEALKQIISKREISALLDGGTFKIRRGELDRYKSRRQSEETIALPPEEAVEAEVVAEAEEVSEAEPTLEAIEETAETVDTEITLEELDSVKAEPPTATPAEADLAGEPVTVELGSESGATEELGLGGDLEVDSLSDDIPLEGDQSKTVSLEVGGGTQAMEVEAQEEVGDLDEPTGDGEGLEARVHVLEARPQGSPVFAAFTVLTSLALLFVGTTLWGFLQDHVPGYLQWMVKP